MVAVRKIHPPRRRPVMRFYTQQHKHYCGIDLHARAMYVCILDQHGAKLVHNNLPTTPEAFLRTVAPYRDDLVVAVECIFTWYWLADLCAQESIAFVLGHALYMKAIHGGKAKNDKIDAHKIAVLLRGGMIPEKTEDAKPVFRALFREVGLPEAIRTDNGAPFASTGIHGLCELNVWW